MGATGEMKLERRLWVLRDYAKQAHTGNIAEVDADFSSCSLCFLLIYSKLLLC